MKKVPADIKGFLEKHKYDRSFKRYSNKYYFNNSYRIYGDVNNNEDVEKYFNKVQNTISYFKNNLRGKLFNEDIEEVEKVIGQYEIAVSKVIGCYELDNCKFNYTVDELGDLFKNIELFYNELSDIWMRKVCQD